MVTVLPGSPPVPNIDPSTISAGRLNKFGTTGSIGRKGTKRRRQARRTAIQQGAFRAEPGARGSKAQAAFDNSQIDRGRFQPGITPGIAKRPGISKPIFNPRPARPISAAPGVGRPKIFTGVNRRPERNAAIGALLR